VHRHSFHPTTSHLRSIFTNPRSIHSHTAHQCSAVQCSSTQTKPIMSTPAPAPRERTGACLCGRIKYRVVGDSRYDTFCHCIPCRKWTGSVAFTASICPKEVCEECPRQDKNNKQTQHYCPNRKPNTQPFYRNDSLPRKQQSQFNIPISNPHPTSNSTIPISNPIHHPTCRPR
jgi:hypothetical protein